MAFFAQHVVLCGKDTLNGTHQRSAFTGEVAVNLPLEVGFEHVTATDADTESHHAIVSTTRCVLIDGVARVEPAFFEEQATERSSRTLGSNENNVDILGRNDTGTVGVGDAEPVREVQSLARSELFLDGGPQRNLRSVRHEKQDHRPFLSCLGHGEERFARHPTVGHGFVPFGFEPRLLAHDHIESVIAQVLRLGGALNAVTDDSDSFVLQSFERFAHGKFFAEQDIFLDTAKIHLCHFLSKIDY